MQEEMEKWQKERNELAAKRETALTEFEAAREELAKLRKQMTEEEMVFPKNDAAKNAQDQADMVAAESRTLVEKKKDYDQVRSNTIE